MRTFDFTRQASDGLSLYFRGWEPEESPVAVVCLVHGLGEHSGRYAHVAAALNQAGYALLGCDLRGHGHPSEWRVCVGAGSRVFRSLVAHARFRRSHHFSRGQPEFAQSVEGICTFRLWDGLYHEIHNEPEKQEVLEYMIRWMDGHRRVDA